MALLADTLILDATGPGRIELDHLAAEIGQHPSGDPAESWRLA
jgi:hypothetical protein